MHVSNSNRDVYLVFVNALRRRSLEKHHRINNIIIIIESSCEARLALQTRFDLSSEWSEEVKIYGFK